MQLLLITNGQKEYFYLSYLAVKGIVIIGTNIFTFIIILIKMANGVLAESTIIVVCFLFVRRELGPPTVLSTLLLYYPVCVRHHVKYYNEPNEEQQQDNNRKIKILAGDSTYDFYGYNLNKKVCIF